MQSDSFPVTHVVSCVIIAVTLVVWFVFFTEEPTASNLVLDGSAVEKHHGIDQQDSLTFSEDVKPEESLTSSTIDLEENLAFLDEGMNSVVIRNGDSLSKIFARVNIPHDDLIAIQAASPYEWKKQRLDIGRSMKFRTDDNGLLSYFEYSPDVKESYAFTRNGDEFDAEVITREIEQRETYRHVTIERGDSTISAGLKAGVREEVTVWQLPKILQWDIDFYHDIHPGDWYQILYYETFVDDEYLEDGDIIAVLFKTRKKTYEIVRWEDDGVFLGYFSRNGLTTRKRFLRTPVEYTRISSRFNPRRLHPIRKVVRPHRGIDYAAPRGTPVYATGDGTVIKASRTRLNGNYVVISHEDGYETRYLHMHRINSKIKQGVSVRQSQLIGQVGSTGEATGPHLHYEFLVNGVHQDPARIHLPDADPLSEAQLAKFRDHSQKIFDRMNTLRIRHAPEAPTIAQQD